LVSHVLCLQIISAVRNKSDNSLIVRDDLVNPFWVTDKDLGTGPVRALDCVEAQFWRKLIDKYLYPIDADKTHEARLVRDLKTLRNNAVFLFFMLNFLWLFIIFLLRIVQEQLKVSLLLYRCLLYAQCNTLHGTEYKITCGVAMCVRACVAYSLHDVRQIFDRFLNTTRRFGLTASLKKNDALHQSYPPSKTASASVVTGST